MTSLLFVAALLPGLAFAQTDTVSYQWPVEPFHTSQYLTATFAEYRNTSANGHFHSGTDIPKADGSPVYPSLDGYVYSLGPPESEGSNAYIRIRTSVGTGWKHITYLHVDPTPGLSAGTSVTAGQTVIGTIHSGQGHVHLTERGIDSDVEINAIRFGGGLNPFVDPWSPVFVPSTLRFRLTGTNSTVQPNQLNGRIDIIVQVQERNAPDSENLNRRNNGTFGVGYRILSADTQTVVYMPPDSGLRFRFDRKPVDGDVGNVFDKGVSTTSEHHYIVTNGSGANAINSSLRVNTSWFDAGQQSIGPYVLHLFTFDTRDNRTDWYVPIEVTDQDLTPPARPTLLSVLPDSEEIVVSWLAPNDPDLGGYRMYVHSDLGADFMVPESTLTNNMISYRLRLPVGFPVEENGLPRVSIRMTAVDTVTPPNESQFTDTYPATPETWLGVLPGRRYLVVDGFDRYGGSGSWSQPIHSLAVLTAQPYPKQVAVGTAANEVVEGGVVPLTGWDLVQWMLGDESTADYTFTSTEQYRVRLYLESGGSLIVSGSEVAWDLGRSGSSSAADISFFNNYMKAQYIYDGTSSMSTASGAPGTPFAGYTWTFGQSYPEDYPDDIEPVGGAEALLFYNAARSATEGSGPRKAGIGFVGSFGTSSTTARLVYFGFPIESISSSLQREVLFQKSLEFMGLTTGVAAQSSVVEVPESPVLYQNYPNPFNPTTGIRFAVPAGAHVTVAVYDLLGRQVDVLVATEMPAGSHTVRWDAHAYASGVYLVRMEVGSSVLTKRIVLLK